MINFRYHLVSLTAVFLALTVGLVLGTAALNGPVVEDLHDEARSLRKSNAQLREQVAGLEDELAGREGYIKEAAPLLLDKKLAGHTVLLVVMPGTKEAVVTGVSENLELADATVTGTLRITGELVDPKHKADARDLATRLLPAGVKEVPADADGPTASAALLAATLLDHDPKVADADRTAALTGYREQQFVSFDKRIRKPAEAAVIVTDLPETEPASSAADRNAAVLAMVREFGKAGPAVVAAPGTAGEGNPVAVVRGDANLRGKLSTVDNVNTTLGRLSAVLAVVQQLTEQRTGHYGISDGANRRLPKLAS